MHIQCKSESFQENLQAMYGYIRKKEEVGSHEKAAHDANVRRTTEKEGIGWVDERKEVVFVFRFQLSPLFGSWNRFEA